MIYGVGLGSNIGDRAAHVRAGIAFLRTLFKPGLRVSSLYQTSPVDCPPGSHDFINAVVEGEFDGDPAQLHRLLKEFEKTQGERPVVQRNAPRALDLDLLYAEKAFVSDELTLPHPRWHLRRFVLEPLAEICPGRTIVGQTVSVGALLTALDSDEVVQRLP
jgi:2-amino-4-hydroxy-6-hydroxymethyldihydropteridine diphosphokinase